MLVAIGVAGSCSPARAPRLSATSPSTVEDDAPLVATADGLEKSIREGGYVVDDPRLQSYLDGLVARLLPYFGANAIPVRIAAVRDPFLNAAAAANGFVLVHTGLLARLENEAQLVSVLGHELEHYLGRHVLRERRTNDRTAAMRQVSDASGDTIVRLVMMIAGSISDAGHEHGYGPDLEREADAASLRAVIAAGYDPEQALRAYQIFADDPAEGGVQQPYSYGDHPALEERIRNCREEIVTLRAKGRLAEGGRVGQAEYEAAITNVLLVDAALDLGMRRFWHANAAIERNLRLNPESARGYYLRGELARRKGDHDPAQLQGIVSDYRRAIALDPNLAEAHRELGLLEATRGNRAEGRKEIARYLELVPDPRDRAILESYLY